MTAFNIKDFSTLKSIVANAKNNNDNNLLKNIQNEVHDYFSKNKYYDFFSLKSSDSQETVSERITKSMRILSSIFHPDKNLNHKEWAHSVFSEINTMADTLKDENKRSEFDNNTIGMNYNFNDIYSDKVGGMTLDELLRSAAARASGTSHFSNMGSAADMFAQFMKGASSQAKKTKQANGVANISLDAFLKHNEIKFSYTVESVLSTETCLSCGGQSIWSNKVCSSCNNKGYVERYSPKQTLNMKLTTDKKYLDNPQLMIKENDLDINLKLNFISNKYEYKDGKLHIKEMVKFQDIINGKIKITLTDDRIFEINITGLTLPTTMNLKGLNIKGIPLILDLTQVQMPTLEDIKQFKS